MARHVRRGNSNHLRQLGAAHLEELLRGVEHKMLLRLIYAPKSPSVPGAQLIFGRKSMSYCI